MRLRLVILLGTAALAAGCTDEPVPFTYAVLGWNTSGSSPLDTISFDSGQINDSSAYQEFADYDDAIGFAYHLTVTRGGLSKTLEITVDTECANMAEGRGLGSLVNETRSFIFDDSLEVDEFSSGISCRGQDGSVDNFRD